MSILRVTDQAGSRYIDLYDEESVYSVGRTGECDLIIEDDLLISNVHASFRCISGNWYVEDMGSTNGTFLHGFLDDCGLYCTDTKLFGRLPIKDGSKIRIGDTVLYVASVGAEAATQDNALMELVLSIDGTSPVDELLAKHLPSVVKLFRSKAMDYAGEGSFTADVLGSRGQFAEIWRKVGKLKRSMWDGRKMEFEQTDEILSDLFGHIMLAIDYNDTEPKVERYRGLK